jgi:Phosphate-selective porin O and P
MGSIALVSRIVGGSALAWVLSAALAQDALAQDAPAPGSLSGARVAVSETPPQLAPPPPPGSAATDPPAPATTKVTQPTTFDDEDHEEYESSDHGPVKDWLHVRKGPLEILPVVLMQVQAVPYVGADAFIQAGDPAEKGGFRFRRARFGFEGRLFHRIPFEITGEYNSDITGVAQLHDAWFGYDPYQFLQAFAGAQDVPFSRSALTGAGDSALIERPFAVQAMAPYHQLGGVLQGHFFSGGLNYYAGIFNGLERNDQFWLGYVENAAILGNLFNGLTYSGRITSEPLGPMGRTMEDLHHGKLKIAAGASLFYSDGGTRGITGLGGDLLLHFRGLHVLAEFIANRSTPKVEPTQPTNQTANVTSWAMIGEAGYMVLRDRLGINARFEWINANTAIKDENDQWILTGGVSYHILHDFLKAQVDYNHREELYGVPLKNDSLVFQIQLNL